MKAYAYSKIDKTYTGQVDRQPDPLDGGYLIPANATDQEPPSGENKVAIFENGSWSLVNDIRGDYFHKSSKRRIRVHYLNEQIPEECTKIEPIDPDDEFERWDEEHGQWVIDHQAKRRRQILDGLLELHDKYRRKIVDLAVWNQVLQHEDLSAEQRVVINWLKGKIENAK